MTRLVALLGHPLEHSLSPVIHNTAFGLQHLNMVYLCLPVRPERLTAAVAGLRAMHCAGANVTIPHKEAVFELVDDVSDCARAVGAVNTLVFEYEKGRSVRLLGDNTDVYGFLEPLQRHLDSLEGESVTLFGSGGAARAVAYALLTTVHLGRLVIAARSVENAGRLAAAMAPFDAGRALHVVAMADAGRYVRSSRLVVNATPIGMYPHDDATPWSDMADFSPRHIVYDLVYNPGETRFLAGARAAGAVIIGGIDMLIHQAAASYRQWTGMEMPVDSVRRMLRSQAGIQG